MTTTKKKIVHRTDTIRARIKLDDARTSKKSMLAEYTLDQTDLSTLIGMVNAGLDDFNSEKEGSCLSLRIASRYMMIISALETMQDKHFNPSPRWMKKYEMIHGNLLEDLGDVLYIYKKLKTSPKGINWPILNAYEAQYPHMKFAPQFQKMDQMLAHKPRFTCPALIRYKQGKNGRN